MQKFFITATGTDAGKTLVTTALCYQLRAAGKTVAALKPLISGYEAGDADSDTARILRSLDQPMENAPSISPWRFAAPLAPSMAAKREGKTIAMDELLTFCNAATAEVVLVEGAGGVMAPLNDTATMLDWMVQLGWPVILVAGSYLGALSHTLTALETLRTRGVALAGIIISESENSGVTLDETASELSRFIAPGTQVIKIPRIAAQSDIWKSVPLLTSLLEKNA